MNNQCSDFASGGPAEAEDAWRRHLQDCERCRDAWRIHAGLTQHLGSLPKAGLGADFGPRLQQRIRQERKVATGQRVLRLALAAYWLFATLASAYILYEVRGVGLETLGRWLFFPLSLIILLSPILSIVLPLQTRWIAAAMAVSIGSSSPTR